MKTYLGLTIRGLVGAAAAVLLGRFGDLRNGARTAGVLSGLVAAASLIAVSQIDSHWQYLLLYGVVGGMTTAGTGFLVMSAVVPRWFLRRRGRAVAFATMGSGAAAFILPPFMAFLLEWVGWRGTWVALGILTIMFASLPALLIRRQPEDVGLIPDGRIIAPTNQSAASQPVRNFTASEAARTKVMWILILAIAAASLSPNGVPSSLVPMYIDKGFSTQVAAWGFSIYGLFSMLSRFFWGFMAERYHIRTVVIAIGLFTAAAMPMMLVLPGNSVLAYSALVGFGIGGFIGTQQLVWPAYFGRSHLGAIAGIVRPFATGVNAAGPLLMAQSFDRTGGYGFGLAGMTVSWVVCAGAMFLARPMKAQATEGSTSLSSTKSKPA
ncbi:MAG: MFS transporter [Chloroflexi bacterium]|nr:MFS transporter [Chloroflexota bacterium]